MLFIKRFWLLFRSNARKMAEIATVFQIILALIPAAFVNYVPKMCDAILGPGSDFVYWVEKVPGSKHSFRTMMKKNFDMAKGLMAQENQKPISPEEQKEFETVMLQISDKTEDILNRMAPNEVWDDYIHIFVLTDKELSKINFLFQGCTGYSKHIAIPVSSGNFDANENAATNPTVSANGAYYRYGQLKQGSNLELKVGFEDIRECTTSVTSFIDGKQAKGKEVVATDYWKFKKHIDAGISRYLRYLIPLFSLIVFVITLTLLRYAKRIAALEQKILKSQQE